jgi:hypothetical protein
MSNRIPFRRTRFAVLALLSTGTLFSACTGRFKDATVTAVTDLIFTALDPGAIASLLTGSDSGAPGGT